jgi:sortase (surface protein transpeptidase)
MEGDPKGRTGPRVSLLRAVRRPAAAAALIAGVILVGVGAAGLVYVSHSGRPAVPVGRPTLVPVPFGRLAAAPGPTMRRVPAPTGLIIPSIGVRSGLIRLGLTSSGALQVPAVASVAGWYAGSPRPGAVGAAVIVGHIDSDTAPGVFFRLRLLRPGRLVYVRRADGSLAVFRVTKVRSYAKARFPTLAVYGPVPNAQLRLITCDGKYDVETGHYLGNLIVYAALTHTKGPRHRTGPARTGARKHRGHRHRPAPRATRPAAART